MMTYLRRLIKGYILISIGGVILCSILYGAGLAVIWIITTFGLKAIALGFMGIFGIIYFSWLAYWMGKEWENRHVS